MLLRPLPGDIIPPWSKAIDYLTPEELNTPDPTSFPDDILFYLSITVEAARTLYNADLETHVTAGIRQACTHMMDLLTSDLAYDGMKMEPCRLDIKPGLPEFLKARARPVREAF